VVADNTHDGARLSVIDKLNNVLACVLFYDTNDPPLAAKDIRLKAGIFRIYKEPFTVVNPERLVTLETSF